MTQEFGHGYARGSDGLVTKKYDPHGARRAKEYEAVLKAHQEERRTSQKPAVGYASNDAGTVDARSRLARQRALAKREEKASVARKFNERHAQGRTRALEVQRQRTVVRSHRDNDAYMDEFHDAYGLGAREKPKTESFGESHLRYSAEASRLGSYRGGGGGSKDWCGAWRDRGPRDARGGVVDASDRPLLCVSVSDDGSDCCVGSADHGAYGLDPFKTADAASDEPQVVSRKLHSKKDGHSDWVTQVAHVPSPERIVVTAGADGKVVAWRGTRGQNLQSAGACISTLLVDVTHPVALSCAYDGRSTLWDVKSQTKLATLGASTAPVLCACWRRGICVAGDRDGKVAAYAISDERCSDLGLWQHTKAGHVLCVAALRDNLEGHFASGAHDGTVCIWDNRTGDDSVLRLDAHIEKSSGKAGAVATICPLSDSFLVATAGADGHLAVFDLRRGGAAASTTTSSSSKNEKDSSSSLLFSFDSHGPDQPLCLTTVGPYVVSGDSRGNVLCHDSKRGDCVWGLGANRGAVRAMDARPDLLVAVGDDGNCVAWRF